MSNEILDNILDDEITSSTPTDQFNLFDNLLEDKKPSVTLKISKTAGKVFDDVIKMAHDITEKERIEEPDDHNLMPYGQSLDPEEETIASDAPYDPHAPKSRPSMSKEEEFVKFIEKEHEGYKDYYTPILNQQVQHIKDCKLHNPSYNQASNMEDVLLTSIPKILDNVKITDLIGIQPMTGPVGLIYHLDYKESDDTTDCSAKRMSLEVVKDVVEAGSRKLQTSMTIEAVQDMNSFHGLDITAEITSAISHEVSGEIDNEWLQDIRAVAHEETSKLGSDRELLFKINSVSSLIAQRSRRGFGNWIVVNPAMLARFQEASDKFDAEIRENNDEYKDITYRPSKSDKFKIISNLTYVGMYRDQIKVYCDLQGTDDNEILVGYKGPSETDTGMIYAPYVMMMSTGVVVDPTTFQPLIKFMTRYGKWVSENASRYYTKLTIE